MDRNPDDKIESMRAEVTTITRHPDDKILSVREVCALLGMGRATFNRLRDRGEFIPPIQLSPGRVGWWRSDVLRWLDNRPRGPK